MADTNQSKTIKEIHAEVEDQGHDTPTTSGNTDPKDQNSFQGQFCSNFVFLPIQPYEAEKMADTNQSKTTEEIHAEVEDQEYGTTASGNTDAGDLYISQSFDGATASDNTAKHQDLILDTAEEIHAEDEEQDLFEGLDSFAASGISDAVKNLNIRKPKMLDYKLLKEECEELLLEYNKEAEEMNRILKTASDIELIKEAFKTPQPDQHKQIIAILKSNPGLMKDFVTQKMEQIARICQGQTEAESLHLKENKKKTITEILEIINTSESFEREENLMTVLKENLIVMQALIEKRKKQLEKYYPVPTTALEVIEEKIRTKEALLYILNMSECDLLTEEQRNRIALLLEVLTYAQIKMAKLQAQATQAAQAAQAAQASQVTVASQTASQGANEE